MLAAVTTGLLAGDFAALMSLANESPLHRRWPVEAAMRIFTPPLRLGSYRLWTDGERVVAGATWAFMNDESFGRFRSTRHLAPADWQSGDQPVVVDLIAPWGHCLPVVRDLQRVFGQRRVTWLRSRRGWKEGWAHGVDSRQPA